MVTVTAEFRLEKDTAEAVDDVRDAVSRVRTDLPQDLREPIVSKLDIAGMPVLTYSIASERMDEEALSWFVDNDVTRALLTVPGVGKVARVGGVQREIRVELDPARLQALNVTAAEISRRVRQVQQESSGGRADIGGAEQSIRTIGTVATAAGHRAPRDAAARRPARPPRPGGLASPTPSPSAAPRRCSTAGRWSASRSAAAAARARSPWPKACARGWRSCRLRIPASTITEAFNFVEPVEQSYVGSMNLLFEGAILAVIVVFLFLRDWRATFVAATALPLSIIPTFAAMYFMGFTINVVTLLAMSLVVGILVDDAIVEIENIVRHLGMGKTPKEAAMEAVEEIGLAVVATTAHAGRRVPADGVHDRRRRQVLQAVRLDRGDRGVRLAAGRAAADADDGRLHPQADRPRSRKDSWVMTPLPGLGRLVPAPSRSCTVAGRGGLLRRAR